MDASLEHSRNVCVRAVGGGWGERKKRRSTCPLSGYDGVCLGMTPDFTRRQALAFLHNHSSGKFP